MTPLTLDASVTIKWFHRTAEERDVEAALELQRAYHAGEIGLYQPPHWRAEVAAVLVRLCPAMARQHVADLCLLDTEQVDTPDVHAEATRIALRVSAHVFDTLYHAVTLDVPGCVLVTADDTYYKRARAVGRIVRLADWRLETPTP